jgi:hypothetical protein
MNTNQSKTYPKIWRVNGWPVGRRPEFIHDGRLFTSTRSIAGTLTHHQNYEVMDVTDEMAAAFLRFLVQTVQEDVG